MCIRISSTRLKAADASSVETGAILDIGGYECELIQVKTPTDEFVAPVVRIVSSKVKSLI